MDATLRRLRSEAQQLTHGKAPTGVRYPVAFRTTAVALARPRLATGVPFVRVARELGLPTKSLAWWLQRRPAPRLRPVAVRPDPAPASAPAASVCVKASTASARSSARASARIRSPGLLPLRQSHAQAGQGASVGRHRAVHLRQAPRARALRLPVAGRRRAGRAPHHEQTAALPRRQHARRARRAFARAVCGHAEAEKSCVARGTMM